MLKTLAFVACAALIAVPAAAESPLDGTWKMVLAKSKFTGKPAEMRLTGGNYSCVSCEIPYTIKADGTYQKRPGTVIDETAVQLISDRMVKMANRSKGKLISESLITVSPDGATRRLEFVEYSPNGMVNRGADTHRRVGAAPAGAHLVSGQWEMASSDELSDSANVVTFRSAGSTITMSTPDGYGYSAVLGGPPVKVSGDRAGTMVQLANPQPNVFVETSILDGKVRGVNTVTIRADGTASVRSENRVNGNSSEHELVRQ